MQIQEFRISEEMISAMTSYYGPNCRYWGKGAEALGLMPGSVVETKELTRLFQLLNPHDRSRLPTNGGRKTDRTAFDLTISFEKEISVLAALEESDGQREIMAMLDEACHAGVSYFEEQACVISRGTDSLRKYSGSGFIAVETDHTTARPVGGNPAMPHLHRHFVMINASAYEEKYSALDSNHLYNLQMVAGAIATQRMQELIAERYGVTWERVGRGHHRIVGFDDDLRTKLSPRSDQLLERALEDGGDPTSRKDMLRAQRVSRSKKEQGVCGNDLGDSSELKESLSKDGITVASLIEKCNQKQTFRKEKLDQIRRDRAWIDLTFPPCPEGGAAKKAWSGTVARELATIHTISTLTERVAEDPLHTFNDIKLAYDRLKAAMLHVESPTEAEIAREIMLNVGRERSTWIPSNLLYDLVDRQGLGESAARAYVASFLKSPDVAYLWGLDDGPECVARPRWKDQARFATSETLAKEKLLIQATKVGIGALEGLLSEEEFFQVLVLIGERDHVVERDSDRYEMLHALLRCGNKIQIVEGQAGAAKSTCALAFTVAEELGFLGGKSTVDEEGVTRHRVVGCTLSARAAKLLTKSSGGVPAYSLTMLTSRIASGRIVLEPGATVFIDEVSQASTSHLHEIYQHIEAVGGRLVLAGDSRQLQSVEAGGLVRWLIQEAPEAVVIMDETFRQSSTEERACLATIHYRGLLANHPHAIKALEKQGVASEFIDFLIADGTQKGGLGACLDWYKSHNRIRIHNNSEEASEATALRFWNAVDAGDEPIQSAAIITARSNQEADFVNKAVVAEAVKRGHLTDEEKIDFGRRHFLKGERVTLRDVDWDLEVFNGDAGEVVGVEEHVFKWEVELETPSPYALTRQINRGVKVGDMEEVRFSAAQVAKERAGATKYREQRRAAFEKAEMSKTEFASKSKEVNQKRANYLAERKAELDKAERRVKWTASLPTKGGLVELKVVARRALETEDALIIKRDDGELRALPAGYVEKHVGSGYVSTEHKGQGDKARVSIAYNHMRYVGISRGIDLNVFEMIINSGDDVITELDRIALAATYGWLSDHLGEEEAEELVAKNSKRRFTDLTPISVELDSTLTVSMMSTTTAQDDRLAANIAAAHVKGERHVGVVRSLEMAADLNEAVIDQLKAASTTRVYSPRIGDHRWVKGMPVVVNSDEIEGLQRGEIYFVSALSKDGLFLGTTDGRSVQVKETKKEKLVTKSLNPAFVVPTARLERGIGDVDKLIAVASGLDSQDLARLETHGGPVELLVPDPEQTAALKLIEGMDKVMLEDHLVKDAGSGWDSRSASEMVAWRAGEEVGLKRLQADIAATAKKIDEVRELSPREVVVRDIERELIGLRNRQKDLAEQVKNSENEEDRLDAQSGLEKTERDIVQANNRYKITTSGLSDDDPEVALVLEKSTKQHGEDSSHLIEIEKLLRHFVQARVTAAVKNPQPYHPSLSTDSNLSVEAAYGQRQELIAAIEEYRAEWALTDTLSALGSDDLDAGKQRDHYDRVARLLSEDEGMSPSYAHTR
jgi:conjugative relaxase-like TrwC/TraI family protein